MMTSGLVITLSADATLAAGARTAILARPGLTLGKLQDRWLPVVAETADVAASRDLHDWLTDLPGIEFVDVVEVNFDDAQFPLEPAPKVIA